MKLEDFTDEFVDMCYRETGTRPGPNFSVNERYKIKDVCPLEAAAWYMGCHFGEVMDTAEETIGLYIGWDWPDIFYVNLNPRIREATERGRQLRRRLLHHKTAAC